ncbi:MAG: hypothetical protein R2818_04130 [Flavobacteriales bacterium]
MSSKRTLRLHHSGSVQGGTITTTTVVEEVSGEQESININMGVNGITRCP